MTGVAFVTGGGAGLGRAVARRFAERGLAVTVVGRREGPLRETIEGLDEALAVPADVRDPDAVRAALQTTVDRWGRLDVVVNAAALLGGKQPQSVGPWDHFTCVLRTNVLGPALVTETAVPFLAKGSVVIHVGSSVADLPTPDALAYGASKAALAHLTASQAVRHVPRGIRVVGIAPGGLHGDGPGLSSMEATVEGIVYLASRYGAHFNGVMLRMDRGEVVRAWR
jgi:NAD(P)-dependent dehydrogenase (short-subunit alcohol dehydrogenase family)